MEMTPPPDLNTACRDVSDILNRIGEKWTVLVVIALRAQPRRFNEIKRQVGGISQQMLARTLKALERDGLVTRTVLTSTPPQVEYALTALGTSLSETVRHVGLWALEHGATINRNRIEFDARD